mgnify:CR=1 FL=1
MRPEGGFCPWPAPAKVNLFLHVLNRRPDGYHQLATAFQFLDWGDTVWLASREDGLCLREDDNHQLPSEDLSVRAARLLAQAACPGKGVTIRLEKRIPLGAGLGGGSSDAATVLLALNHMWRLHWDTARLAELGLLLGADVPVFVHGQAAWAFGVGELLFPDAFAQGWTVVLVPPVPVATNLVFQAWDASRQPALTRNMEYHSIKGFPSPPEDNDCLEVTSRLYPDVGRTWKWLRIFGRARMSGTGGAVFAVFETRAGAERIACMAQNQLGPLGVEVILARLCNRSSLHQASVSCS